MGCRGPEVQKNSSFTTFTLPIIRLSINFVVIIFLLTDTNISLKTIYSNTDCDFY